MYRDTINKFTRSQYIPSHAADAFPRARAREQPGSAKLRKSSGKL
jgi:hypothetical protein